VDRAAARSRFDPADLEHRLFRTFEHGAHWCGLLRSEDDGHADAAVEGARHFFRRNPAAFLKQRENARQLPSVTIYDGMAAIR
jgi:hypothetical protein